MKKIAYVIVAILFVCNIFSWSYLCLQKDDFLKVVFFDVGQGDGIFIETPDKKQIVIDGGNDYNLMAEKISHEVPFWDKDLDAVILTHCDSDHMNGLFGVLKDYKVNNILWTGIGKEGSEEKIANWNNMIEQEKKNDGASVVLTERGKTIIAKNITIDFFWPKKILDDEDTKSNEDSLVLKLCYIQSCFLFTGDISASEEKELIDKNIQAEILKVAHHGSKYSSSTDFLKNVSPKLAVISVGKNSYGHPDVSTIGRLQDVGAKIVRTDERGDITIYSDGTDYGIVYQKSGEQSY